jgi:hypothetical protein
LLQSVTFQRQVWRGSERLKGRDGLRSDDRNKRGQKEIAMKHFTVLLVAVLVFNSVAVTQATQTQGASQAAKVKTEVQKRGIGEKSRVKVRLRNKAEVKGYISKIEDASFDVTDKKTGRATPIPYADAEMADRQGISSLPGFPDATLRRGFVRDS